MIAPARITPPPPLQRTSPMIQKPGRAQKGSKMKVLGIRRNQRHCVRLVFLIPAIYLLRQTGSVCERYRVLSENPNRGKKGGMTVQCVQCHVARSLYGPYRRRGNPWRRHVAGDVAYGRQLDQSMGDTWHGMTSAGDVAVTAQVR